MHEWPFDCDWCERCGQSRLRVVEERLECIAGPKVVAVSARVYRKRTKPWMQAILNKMGEPA